MNLWICSHVPVMLRWIPPTLCHISTPPVLEKIMKFDNPPVSQHMHSQGPYEDGVPFPTVRFLMIFCLTGQLQPSASFLKLNCLSEVK